MKPNNVLRFLCFFFLSTSAIMAFVVLPAAASYSWENNITVSMDSMTWEYLEQYSGPESVFFKSAIDSELGNNDGFVAAWEILKIDTVSRKNLHQSISGKMDVKINDSSAHVSLSGVGCDMSGELLGSVSKQEQVSNIYRVRYDLKEPLIEQGSRIWFQGEPDTPVVISMPEGIDILSVEGMDNATISMQGHVANVRGNFGFTGEAVVVFRENSTVSRTQVSEVVADLKPVQNRKSPSVLDEVFPGTTDRLLEMLERSSKL